MTWGAIAVVVIAIVALVAASQVGKGAPTPSAGGYSPSPVPAPILREVTHVPASSYDEVGISSAITAPPVVRTQPALTLTGKPGIFVLDGEFCPYCAAERWAVITSLSRFGTFSGLKTMESSPRDIHPKTQTFEFATTKYSSKYITAKLLEMFGQEKSTGRRPIIRRPTKVEDGLMQTYDSGSSVPFLDVGNVFIYSGSSYTPGILSGLSRAAIAAELSRPSSPVSKLILGASNYISAAICSVDGGEPGLVCSSSGVTVAAAALKLRL